MKSGTQQLFQNNTKDRAQCSAIWNRSTALAARSILYLSFFDKYNNDCLIPIELYQPENTKHNDETK